MTSEEFKVLCDKSLFCNHDERDDDDVKYARRDWDENVTFGGKNLSSEDNLVPRSLVDEAEGEIWQSKKICFS